ncbi:MAG: InlB B-repeat-containing protein [Ruminococcus flavefaciens]|nr:InlB B-repeat-containing protein [Ruminococcus flavefaciens]
MKIRKICAELLLLAVLVTAFTGCMRSDMTSEEFWNVKESGDFLYYVRTSGDKKVAWIVGFSEQGKEKELIVIPTELEGYTSYIPQLTLFAYNPKFESEKLKWVYFYAKDTPFRAFQRNSDTPNLEKATSIYYHQYMEDGIYEQWTGETYCYIKDESVTLETYRNNACFLLNTISYNDSNDEWRSDLYWSDHYEEDQIIDVIPPVPEREGYVFAGWYEDSECTKPYVFEEVFFAIEEPETRFGLGKAKVFYAKWIAE